METWSVQPLTLASLPVLLDEETLRLIGSRELPPEARPQAPTG